MNKKKGPAAAATASGAESNDHASEMDYLSSGLKRKGPGEAIAEAIAAFPVLTPQGFGVDDPTRFDHEEVATALEFLRGCRRTTKATQSSRLVRRLAEEWSEATGGVPSISLGAIIIAAHAHGYPITLDYGDASIGIHKADLSRLIRMRERARR